MNTQLGVRNVVEEHVNALVGALDRVIHKRISAEIQAYFAHGLRLGSELVGKAAADKKKQPRRKRTDAEMRCVHGEGKRRCKLRSGGPRFHFLCKKHREKPVTKVAKKAKSAKVTKSAAQPAAESK